MPGPPNLVLSLQLQQVPQSSFLRHAAHSIQRAPLFRSCVRELLRSDERPAFSAEARRMTGVSSHATSLSPCLSSSRVSDDSESSCQLVLVLDLPFFPVAFSSIDLSVDGVRISTSNLRSSITLSRANPSKRSPSSSSSSDSPNTSLNAKPFCSVCRYNSPKSPFRLGRPLGSGLFTDFG